MNRSFHIDQINKSTMFLMIVASLLILLYFYYNNKSRYWAKRNVKYISPFPIIGSIWKSVVGLQSFAEEIDALYNAFPEERYVGLFLFNLTPVLFIRDPELIKQITVKDFDTFPVHKVLVDPVADPLWGKNLISSRAKRWRELRPTLSATFTSSKMKMMYELMKECAEEFVNYFYRGNDEEISTINSKDAFNKYTNDVIATAAFGVKCNSFKEPDNEILILGMDATNFKGFRFAKYLLGPQLCKFLNIKVFSKRVRHFFTNLIKDTIEVRATNGTIRPDMIHLLMEIRKGNLQEMNSVIDTGFATAQESVSIKSNDKKKIDLSLEEIVAQALIFYLAGFDSSSTLLSYLAHELAINPVVQKKLRIEIDETDKDSDNNITYERLMKMKYLDMVVCETLRKWPSATIYDRINLKRYTIPSSRPEEPDLHLEPNTMVVFSIYSLHRDSKLFPEPEEFDPERFNEVNKHKIPQYGYIPFGTGPRICLGSRFALMETKLLIYYMLKYFALIVIEKTPIPMKLSPEFHMIPLGGFWIGLKKRSHPTIINSTGYCES